MIQERLVLWAERECEVRLGFQEELVQLEVPDLLAGLDSLVLWVLLDCLDSPEQLARADGPVHKELLGCLVPLVQTVILDRSDRLDQMETQDCLALPA